MKADDEVEAKRLLSRADKKLHDKLYKNAGSKFEYPLTTEWEMPNHHKFHDIMIPTGDINPNFSLKQRI